jgi:hypothetical protein
MNNEIPNSDSEKSLAFKKVEQFGTMSLTAKEHKLIGSTPPANLLENPDKNSFDLMSDDEIKAWVEKQSQGVRELEGLLGRNLSAFGSVIENYKASIEYLKSIGRLPEGFENLGG